MPEIENGDPRAYRAIQNMIRSMAPQVVVGRAFDGRLVEQLTRLMQEHRSAFKRDHGYDLPPLTPFALPSIGFLIFYRSDLEDIEIRRKLLILLRQLNERSVRITATELAKAVQLAWPSYRPPIEEMRADSKLNGKPLR